MAVIHTQLYVALVLVSTFATVHAQGDPATAGQVSALVARYDSAWNRQDTVEVSRLLAPQYQYFTSRGGVTKRAETLAFLGAPDYRLEQARRSEIEVALSGPVAVVSSRWQGHGTWRGEAFNDDQRCGQTWVRTDRTWQMVSEHCVQIERRTPSW